MRLHEHSGHSAPVTVADTVYVVDEGDDVTHEWDPPDADERIDRWARFFEATFDRCSPGAAPAYITA